MFKVFVLTAVLFIGTSGLAADAESLVLDDFQSTDSATIGTRWEGFTDRVMGGISSMRAGYMEEDGDRILRMAGRVSLENNGGFIQVRLPLATRGTFDASAYEGVAVEVRGAPGSYYLHMRTRGSRLPWQYYEARLAVVAEWQRVEIPFKDFVPQSTRQGLTTTDLVSLAVVGGKAEFDADISVRLIEFYK